MYGKLSMDLSAELALGSSPGLVSSAFPCRAAAVRGFPGLGFGACLHFHLQIQIRC